MKFVFRTEDATLYVNKVETYGSYVFIKDGAEGILCRIIGEDEKLDRAPDAILSHDYINEQLYILTRQFSNSKSTFECVEYNNYMLHEAMADFDQDDNIVEHDPDIDTIPKAISYDYLYNYFGREQYAGKVVTGAYISIAFRPHKNGSEVKFLNEEPKVEIEIPSRISDKPCKETYYLCNLVSVSFDRDTLYKLDVNEPLKLQFLKIMGWDDITLDIVERGLVYEETPSCSAPMPVNEEDWNNFLKGHLDDFDIKDNVKAQCPSFGWLE